MRWNEITESEEGFLTKEEILNLIPDLAKTGDLDQVVGWFHGKRIEDLRFQISSLPISKIENAIIEMIGTYEEFPVDARRTRKIFKSLQSGAHALPVFIEYGDSHLFVMEGRHRMVAFYQIGMKEIPVVFVKAF